MNSPPFLEQSIWKGLPMTLKAASGYFGQIVWYWIEGNVPRLIKSTLTRTIKASRNLPVATVKFPPVT